MYRLCDGIEFLKSLPDQSLDGIFTDPTWKKGPPMAGQERWLDLISEMTQECGRVFKPSARALIWVGMKYLGETIKAVKALEYRWTVLVRYIPPRYVGRLLGEFDPVILFMRPGDRLIRPKCMSAIYTKPSVGAKDTKHPCARNADVVKWFLRDWFDEGEYVIDPFAGSDTVGYGCRQLGLLYDTCEIDPEMYKTGLERNSQKLLFENQPKSKMLSS